MVKVIFEKGYVFIVGVGKIEWDYVYIDDLGDLFVRFVDVM